MSNLAQQIAEIANEAWNTWGMDCAEGWEWPQGWGSGDGWMAKTAAAEMGVEFADALATARTIFQMVNRDGERGREIGRAISEAARTEQDAIVEAFTAPLTW